MRNFRYKHCALYISCYAFLPIRSVLFIMTIFITSVSVAQIATFINVSITIVQWTLPLFLIALLVHFMPKINTALAWSSITRTLHSSLWPIILRTDTCSTGSGAPVLIISFLTTATALLVIVAGAITPLGLKTGPVLLSGYRQFPAQYVPDNSALTLATTPRREDFMYGRQCGLHGSMACPGNDSPTTAAISPNHVRIFNSTSHGPFTMQYRQFFNDKRDHNLSEVIFGTAEILLLRNDTFVTEGLIVDMSEEHPGIGFLNQTMPKMESGGTWSQDVLWLEPVTACVNTNLTIDYFLPDPSLSMGLNSIILDFNITNRGGFSNTVANSTPPGTGQELDLYQHAYSGAVFSNLITMQSMNITSPAPLGQAYQINQTNGGVLLSLSVGKITTTELRWFETGSGSLPLDAGNLCRGFTDSSTTNISTIHISCGTMFGPPIRTDGGDSKVFSSGSKWSQEFYSCASTTRASIQAVTFSASKPLDLQGLQVSRSLSGRTALWAVEKTDLKINEVDLLWGRVDDQYENSSSLWTIRSDHFYLPATKAYWLGNLFGGSPQSAHGVVWGEWIYSPVRVATETVGTKLADYTGQNDYAMKNKFQSLVQNGHSDIGASRILNLIWTDIMANNLIGTQTDTTLLAAQNLRSIDYDFRFAVFGMILLAIWVPSFLGALFLLVSRTDSFKDMKSILNHLSVGRVIVGSSALHVIEEPTNNTYAPATNDSSVNHTMIDLDMTGGIGHHVQKKSEKDTVGKPRVLLELGPL